MKIRYFAIVLFALCLAVACSDDENGNDVGVDDAGGDDVSDEPTGSSEGFALQVVNTSADDGFEIFWDDDEQHVIYCYDDGECDDSQVDGHGELPDSTSITAASEPGRTAVSADVRIEVDTGEGEVNLVSGTSSPGTMFPDFTIDSDDPILDSSGPVSEGDMVTLSVGDVDM